MKTFLLTLLIFVSTSLVFSQQWQQLAGEPEGGGVTDIYLQESTNTLFVATGSLNWPNGEYGGIRRSTDDGNTWLNLFDSYASRVIMEGPDGNLYASVWDYPSDEGLYRSTDNGDTWDLLVSVPSGNNIFSIAVKEGSPNIIYAGTRTGVYRSLDNGSNWSYINNGIPGDAWVRSMAVSPDGTIAAGTTYGLYVSSDNGDTWDKVTGDGENDNIISITFDTEPSKSKTPVFNLLFGNDNGQVFITTSLVLFTVAYLCATIATSKEVTRVKAIRNPITFNPIYMISMYAALGGAFYIAISQLAIWQLFMSGLPSNALVSMFTASLLAGTTVLIMYVALYGNSKDEKSGCEIYKATFDMTTAIETMPYASNNSTLFQNFPNPFKDQTRINFNLADNGFTSLKIFDLAGNEVKALIEENLKSGKHSINVSSSGLKAGIYYYVLRSKDIIETKKLVIQ